MTLGHYFCSKWLRSILAPTVPYVTWARFESMYELKLL